MKKRAATAKSGSKRKPSTSRKEGRRALGGPTELGFGKTGSFPAVQGMQQQKMTGGEVNRRVGLEVSGSLSDRHVSYDTMIFYIIGETVNGIDTYLPCDMVTVSSNS